MTKEALPAQSRSPAAIKGGLRLLMVVGLLLAGLMVACQPSPQELWSKAQTAITSGDLTTAAIHLKNLLQQEPNNRAARAALGELALAMGDPVSAEKELRRAKSLGGDTAALQLTLVEALLAQGRFQDALTELGAAGSGPSTDVRTLMLAGRAQEGLGHLAEAEERYRAAMATATETPEPLVATASVLLKAGRATDADTLIERALQIDPRNTAALVVKGRRILETRGAPAAEGFFRQALGTVATPPEKSQILINLAEIQLIRADLKGASESVSRLESLMPGDILTRYLRARLQAQSGDYANAINALQQINHDAPGFRPAERLLGTVHYLNGNFEQAAMYISRVIGEGDRDPFLGRLLAELRLQQNRPEQAMQTLLPMIRQGPGAVFDQGLLALAGQVSMRIGDNQSAISYFQRGSEEYPDDERFRLGEISARLASGDAATARTMLESMRASSTNPLAVDYLSVMAYLVEHDNARADALAQRLARENDGVAWSHLLLATVHLASGRAAEARQQFDLVLSLEPSNKEALINLARLDIAEGDIAAGESRLQHVIESDPADFRPHMLLSESQLASQHFNQALDQARAALKLAPETPAALNLVGRAAAAAGRWDEARDSFRRITALDPKDARAWLNLARATVAAGQRDTMPDSMTRAMAIAPQDPVVLMTAGDLFMELRQPDAAIDNYRRAYGLAPSGELAIRTCRAQLIVKKTDDCQLLSAWLEKNPKDMVARLFNASAHQSLGNRKGATAEYEAALKQDPRQPVALNNLAWLYFEQGDARALPLAERALEAQPDSPAVTDTLGWINIKNGDRRRGLELIASAAKRDPSDGEIQYHLAYAQAENGDLVQARKTLSAVLATMPKFPSRAEAEGLMRRLDADPRNAGG